jgi:hypothetical protein
MPRLIDGQLPNEGKFKKRRAWLTTDDPIPALPAVIHKPETPARKDTQEARTQVQAKQDYNKSVTRVEQDCNKSVTRLEQECNKTVTRAEQKKPHKIATKPIPEKRVEQDYNKSVTRVEQEYNKSVTRVEHEHSQTLPSKAHETFFDFLDTKRASLFNFESHDPKASLVILSELQRQVFWHVAKQCLNRNVHHTGPIEIKSFFNELDTSTAIVRTTLNRLREKRLIQREQGKLGRNGFAIISLPSLIYDAAKEILAEYEPR